MFFRIFKDITSSWYGWYKHHRKSHDCGIREAASWAWWNAWNPTNGKTIFRNCWLSNEAMTQINDKEKEWLEIFSKVVFREHRLVEKLKKIMNMKAEDYVKKSKEDNKDAIKNLQKMIKKAQKAKKVVDT